MKYLGIVLAFWSGLAHAQFTVPGFELAFTFPVETTLDNADLRAPDDIWCEIFNGAKQTLDLAEMYVSTDPSGEQLNRAITCLEAAAKRGVKIRFTVEKAMMGASNQEGIDRIKAIPGIDFQIIEWAKINGSGIIHAKYIVADGGHQAYVGSQNFDWRALKHIHETGLKIDDEHIAGQIQAVFDQDWKAWKKVNQSGPFKDLFPLRPTQKTVPIGERDRPAYLVASPWKFNPNGVGDSETEIAYLMGQAKQSIEVVVMDYAPLGFGTGFYSVIDNAIRAAAVRGVKVRMAIANWTMDGDKVAHVKSLSLIPNVDIRVVTLPEAQSGFIPFARVVHSKFMVVDGKTSWVGTSNWTGGYLDSSRNLELVLKDENFSARLQKLQQQLFNSPYAEKVDVNKVYPKPHKG